jgi:hypothetical protein
MVSPATDASYTSPPEQDLADKVAEKVKCNLIEEAYALMKDGVKNINAGRDEDHDGVIDSGRSRGTDIPLNDKEKEQVWKDLSAELKEKDPLIMSKLSAAWLKDLNTELKSYNMPLTTEIVKNVASSNRGESMAKTLAGAALPDINNVAALDSADGKFTDRELQSNIGRQIQIPREEFVKKVVDFVSSKSAANPEEAMKSLYNIISDRASRETQPETMETFKQVAEALKNKPEVVAKLSMPWMLREQEWIDTNDVDRKDNAFSRKEINDFSSRCDSVGKVFAEHIKANFDNIATTSTYIQDANRITRDEVDNYNRRLKVKGH